MKKKILFLLILFIPFMVSAYELEIDWHRNISIEGDLRITNDEEIIAFGNTSSSEIEGLKNKGKNDAYIIKYDKNGNIIWKNSFGGKDDDIFNDIYLTESGEIIAYGYTESLDIEGLTNEGNGDAIIVKYDKNGNIIWKNSFGGINYDLFDDLVITKSGDIIIKGYIGLEEDEIFDGFLTVGDVIIIKYNKDGDLIWQKIFGGNEEDIFHDIVLTETGDILAYGFTKSNDIIGIKNNGKKDAIIVKYDNEGNLIWQKNFGGNEEDTFAGIRLTKTEEVIAYGYSNSTDIEGIENKGSYDGIIIKYDKEGNVLWKKNWGGSGGDRFSDLIITKEDKIIVMGSTNSYDIEGLDINDTDALLLKFDENGNLIWQKNFGGNDIDEFHDIVETDNEDIIVIGYIDSSDVEGIPNNHSEAIIVRYDKNGNLVWKKGYGDEKNKESFLKHGIMKNGDIIVIGYTQSYEEQISSSSSPPYPIAVIYDKNGNEKWEKVYNSYSRSVFKDFFITKNNNVILYDNDDTELLFVKHSLNYEIKKEIEELSGTSTVEQQGRYGIVKPTPNEGYEVDKIIVKDKSGNVLDVEVTKQEDGTYSFELYTDVSVEVLFKEKLVNPKTGVSSFIGVMFTLMLIGISGFFMIRNCNNSYEL